MRKLINSNITKVFVVVVALIIMSASFCSMSTMKHEMDNSSNCMTDMTSSQGCASIQQTESCVNFHFGLLEKFSHSFADNLGFKFLFSIVTLGVLLYSAKSLLETLRRHADIPRVRLRQLSEDIITVFQDSLGYWLSIFEKRDPSYSFALA
jgi:hypothetical protein